MPSKSRWLLQIPSIIDQVMSLDTPVLDRAVCERIFGVRRRRAIDLMQQFGGYRAGNTILIDRLDLIRRLQSMADEPMSKESGSGNSASQRNWRSWRSTGARRPCGFTSDRKPQVVPSPICLAACALSPAN